MVGGFIDNMVEKLTYDSKLPRETDTSFQKFLLYRDLHPHERSIRKVAEQIVESDKDLKKTMRSLNQLCTNWSWVERCKLYDAARQLELVRKRADKFNEFNEIMLDNTDGLIRYANNLLGEVIKNPVKENGERYSLASRIKMAKEVSGLLKESNELACNITGRPHEYKELNVNADVEADVTLDKFIDDELIKKVLQNDE